MKLQYFGDSYDIVKKSLLAWLKDFGPWVTHPMFTESFSTEAEAFRRMLETPLVSVELLTPQTNREKYFSECRGADNLFLDPDTGVRLESCRGKKSVRYIFGSELVDLCRAKPKSLTLVFDQCFSRQFDKKLLLRRKLQYFAEANISAIAYDSHATFLLLGADANLINRARKRVMEVSGLPTHRLVLAHAND
jgi:hypothetical protein